MAIGTVTKYDKGVSTLLKNADRQWDDATAGNIMFCLAKAVYTPSTTHSTVADLGVADTGYIATGDGAPINAPSPSLDDTTTPGSVYFDSLAANFGNPVTITAKYLVAVQPAVAGTFASTAKLLWYVDLETGGGSVSSTNSEFVINTPTNGWCLVA